jgi:hypothetical protein
LFVKPCNLRGHAVDNYLAQSRKSYRWLRVQARATRHSIAHQRIGKRHPLPSHAAEEAEHGLTWAGTVDALLGLLTACAKQAVRFWDYFGSRLGVLGAADAGLARWSTSPALTAKFGAMIMMRRLSFARVDPSSA